MKHTNPIWLDPNAITYPSVDRDLSVDVAVIGGGIAGVSAARWLYGSGVSNVTVLEARTVASGASGRNAGFVMAVSPENFPPTSSTEAIGRARDLWQFTERNQRLIEETIAEFALEVEYRREGSLALAAHVDEWEWIVATSHIARESGIAVELIDREDLETSWLREHYFGGTFYGGNGEINPGKFVRALARQLAGKGVDFYENSPVECFTASEPRANGAIQLRVGDYSIRANKVLFATNAYTSNAWPEMGSRISPIRGQVLATMPLSREVVPCPVYANNGYQYWRQTMDRRLVLGGWRDMDIRTEVGTQEGLNVNIQRELERVATGLVAEDIAIDLRWSGIMGFTEDRLPLVGVPEGYSNVAICAGFNGHGLAMAVHAAKVSVDALLGREGNGYQFLAPDRHKAS